MALQAAVKGKLISVIGDEVSINVKLPSLHLFQYTLFKIIFCLYIFRRIQINTKSFKVINCYF